MNGANVYDAAAVASGLQRPTDPGHLQWFRITFAGTHLRFVLAFG
ncbi:hypothetical protein ACFU6S_36535 [Streptomyces sp. NPDC057456]